MGLYTCETHRVDGLMACVYISGRERATQRQYVQHKPPRGQTTCYQLEQEVKTWRWSLLVFLWCRSQLDNVCACVCVLSHVRACVCAYATVKASLSVLFSSRKSDTEADPQTCRMKCFFLSSLLTEENESHLKAQKWDLTKSHHIHPLPVSWETDF